MKVYLPKIKEFEQVKADLLAADPDKNNQLDHLPYPYLRSTIKSTIKVWDSEVFKTFDNITEEHLFFRYTYTLYLFVLQNNLEGKELEEIFILKKLMSNSE